MWVCRKKDTSFGDSEARPTCVAFPGKTFCGLAVGPTGYVFPLALQLAMTVSDFGWTLGVSPTPPFPSL